MSAEMTHRSRGRAPARRRRGAGVVEALALACALPLVAAGASPPVRAVAASAAVSLRLAAWTSDPSAVVIGAVRPPGGLGIDEAWLSAEELRFREQGTCRRQASGRPDLRGPVLGELVTGRATGLAGPIPVRKGRLCGFELALRQATGTEAAGAPSPRGLSLILIGHRHDGVRFTVRSRRAGVLRLRARDPEGFAIAEDATPLFLAADLARWMSGVDLSAAEITGDRRDRHIVIDERSNPGLLAIFEANVAAGLGVFRDRDGDGRLTADERADPDCLRAP